MTVSLGDEFMVDNNNAQRHQRFEELVMPEVELMYRTAWSLTRSDVEAQDLVQDTMLKAFNAIDRFDGRYPRAWLMTILRNTNINRARKKRPDLLNDPETTFERSTEFADRDSPELLVVDPTLDPSLESAFNALPDSFREVIELIDLNGLAYRDAAELLDIPVGTVMSRLHRARKRLRDQLEQDTTERAAAR